MAFQRHHTENCRETCSALLDHLSAKHKQVITVATESVNSFITEQNPCLKVNWNLTVRVGELTGFAFSIKI